MALRTLAAALEGALDDLRDEDFQRFCGRLADRRTEPRVRRSRVDRKSRVEVTEVLVNTFTEREAVRVAVEILTSISCRETAKSLEAEAAEISSPAAKAAGNSSASGSAPAQHFVDQHQLELVNRVTNVAPILDRLLDRGVIQQERYEAIRAIPTRHDQMRALYSGPLQAGPGAKDLFYDILQQEEKFLIQDLREQNL